jgi:predicted nucleic acid-binding protein
LPEVICNTSPIQYLHQLELLHLLPALASTVVVPESVVDELNAGRVSGVNLPEPAKLDWMTVRRPRSETALPLITDLGKGEAEVLMLALEMPGTVVVLDDGFARRVAESLRIPLTGTLGLLLDAKRAGLITNITPFLDALQRLRFRLAPHTRRAVLKIANEESS